MIQRIAAIGAVLALAAFFVLHLPPSRPPAPAASLPLSSWPGANASRAGFEQKFPRPHGDTVVVYVTGAVERPGLYQLRGGDRYARAVALAGGLTPSADSAGVNLAQRALDGDEIDVPLAGEASRASTATRRSTGARHHRSRKRSPAPPPDASVDINAADAAELAGVPGIGRAVAGRIVELRQREGSFTTLDELL